MKKLVLTCSSGDAPPEDCVWCQTAARATQVEAINIPQAQAMLTDGRVVPIVDLYDADDEPTTDPADAASLVCGVEGEWYAVVVALYEGAHATRH